MSPEYKSPSSYLDPSNKIVHFEPENPEQAHCVMFEEFCACDEDKETAVNALIRLMYSVYRDYSGDNREITGELLLEYGFDLTTGFFDELLYSHGDFVVTFKKKNQFFEEGFYYAGHDYIKLDNMQDVKNTARVLFNINLRDVQEKR